MASPAPTKRYTIAEYYALEEASEEKHDYFDGHIFQTMTAAGNEERHDHICLNIRDALRLQLRERMYQVSDPPMSGSNTATNSLGPPDIAVFRARSRPLVVIEVISPSKEASDRGAKASHYRDLESVQQMVIVAQHLPEVEIYLRQADDSWSVRYLEGLGETLELPLIGVTLPFEEIYRRVRFPAEPFTYE